LAESIQTKLCTQLFKLIHGYAKDRVKFCHYNPLQHWLYGKCESLSNDTNNIFKGPSILYFIISYVFNNVVIENNYPTAQIQ